MTVKRELYMREADLWLYTETAKHLRNKKIAVVYEDGLVHLRRIFWTAHGPRSGNYAVTPLGSGKTFYAAYKDARAKGRIRRVVR